MLCKDPCQIKPNAVNVASSGAMATQSVRSWKILYGPLPPRLNSSLCLGEVFLVVDVSVSRKSSSETRPFALGEKSREKRESHEVQARMQQLQAAHGRDFLAYTYTVPFFCFLQNAEFRWKGCDICVNLSHYWQMKVSMNSWCWEQLTFSMAILI